MDATERHIRAAGRGRASAFVQAGFTLIECLITFAVLVIGLLGLVRLQTHIHQAEIESYQRGQALVLLGDIMDRMNANRTGAKNQEYVTAVPVGTGSTSPTPLNDCSGLSGAPLDLCEWGNLLIGASEKVAGGACSTTSGASCAGAMLGAKGCISYNNASELIDSVGVPISGTGIQTVQVWWQGVARAGLPIAISCGANNLAADTQRRIVSATLRMGGLRAK